jgi:hypothetical protein
VTDLSDHNQDLEFSEEYEQARKRVERKRKFSADLVASSSTHTSTSGADAAALGKRTWKRLPGPARDEVVSESGTTSGRNASVSPMSEVIRAVSI